MAIHGVCALPTGHSPRGPTGGGGGHPGRLLPPRGHCAPNISLHLVAFARTPDCTKRIYEKIMVEGWEPE